jgi:hypothetical protein
VGGLIRLADVRLDFDDPADPPTRCVVADESAAQECARGREARTSEARSVRDRTVRDRSVARGGRLEGDPSYRLTG